ncbi:MAG: Immune inhibitor A [Syntrophomonadaceae bacterium]|nr:Immune inhibitor A [Bacillota bacterium]
MQITKRKLIPCYFPLVISFVLCILYPLSSLCAAPPRDGIRRPDDPIDGVARIADPIRLRTLGYSAAQIRQAIGSEGTKNIAVIFMNFPSADGTTSGFPTILGYPTIVENVKRMTTFYAEASYGRLNLAFFFFPSTFSAYTANHPMQNYAGTNGHILIKEGIQQSGVRKSIYNAVMVVHAGFGRESTFAPGDIYSAFYSNFAVTNGFTEGFIVPEFQHRASPFGVYVHEMGHQLGLPDLYNTVTGRSQVGVWCLMDYGTWAGNGAKPSMLSAWCREYLGWLDVSTVTTSGKHHLKTATSDRRIHKIRIDVATNPDKEYFLIEYRRKDDPAAFYDKALPGNGVLIWHINNAVGVVRNNDVNNYAVRRVDLEEADNSDPSTNRGDRGDPWPGQKLVFSSPDSNAYNGQPSGVAIGGFNFHLSSVTFSIDKILASPTLALLKAINYPNPAGRGYFHPRAGIMTTINFQMSRPAQSMNLAIYNLSGERILNVPKDKLALRMGSGIGGSSDGKWVYEYDWDGKDESGNPVAPGIYLYRLRADNQVKVGKMVVER